MRKVMPNMGFKLMTFTYFLHDYFKPVGNILDKFDIQKGNVIVDYGCGPGRYIRKAFELVGENGKVYAVDIHPLAVKSVEKKTEKYKLKNVVPVLVQGNRSSIKDNSADIIYALDMFHHVTDAEGFFRELNRIIKASGKLYIEDGHQSREKSIKKIEQSKLWNIREKNDSYLRCSPVKNKK